MTAAVSSGMLLAGLGSVMLIANQVANTPVASAERVAAAKAVSDLANDLRYSTFLIARTSHALEFVVADRNNDGSGERIRYEWSGVPGAPLLKTTNGGTPVAVVNSVQDFQLTTSTTAETTSYNANVDSAETMLTGYTVSPSSSVYDITPTSFFAQRLDPASFSGAPAGATAWNATRVEFVAQKQGDGETLRVQVCSAGDPANRPTGEVLGETTILEDTMAGGLAWRTLNFPSPIRGLALHRPYSLVWRGTSGESGTSARLARDTTATTGTSQSSDAGATWNYVAPQCVYYRLYGTYTSPGTAVNVTRNYATRVGASLQTGDSAPSRIDASVPLLNRPELLAAYWRADFDSNPTTIDLTRDGTNDWTMAGGASFNNGSLVAGMWQSNGSLESRPKNNFTTATIVEARCRNTGVGGNGAELKIQVDRQAGTHAPLIVRVQRQADGSQTLTLYGKSNDATEVKLCERKNLANDFVRYRLTILPANNLVNLSINDQNEGTYTYSTFAPTNDDRFLTFCANTSTAEYDYVEMRVAE
ncbi:MAG: hypothetical protein AB7G28_13860 [Pirellulales bacterium]